MTEDVLSAVSESGPISSDSSFCRLVMSNNKSAYSGAISCTTDRIVCISGVQSSTKCRISIDIFTTRVSCVMMSVVAE